MWKRKCIPGICLGGIDCWLVAAFVGRALVIAYCSWRFGHFHLIFMGLCPKIRRNPDFLDIIRQKAGENVQRR